MKFNKNSLNKPWVAYTVAACIAVLLYAAVTHLSLIFGGIRAFGNLARPVFLGIVFAYILDPLARLIEKSVLSSIRPRRLQRIFSILLTILAVILFISVLMILLVPQIVDSISMFMSNLNIYVRSLQLMLHRLNQTAAGWNIDLTELISSGDTLLDRLRVLLPKSLAVLMENFYNIGRSFMEGFIACILAIYFLFAKDFLVVGIRRFLHAVLGQKAYSRTVTFSGACNTIMVRYIAFSLIDALLVGTANWIFMSLFRMPYGILISVLVAVFNLAPTFGPIIGGILGALFLLLVKPWYAVLFLLFTLVIQLIDGYVIKPKLFGDQLGVPAVWILVSIIVSGRIFGLVGILIAIPLAAIADYTYQNYIITHLEKRREELDKDENRDGDREEPGPDAAPPADISTESSTQTSETQTVCSKDSSQQ